MKLATYKDGSRDGQLVVVSRDLAQAHYANGIASRLQQVLDDWNFLSPQLEDLYLTLNHGKARHAFPFEPRQCMAPLPRAYQWADGSAFINHVELVRKARGAEVPIPTDVVTAKEFKADAKATVKRATEVEDDDLILDIGPETAARLAEQLMAAGTIVWNGPVGVFEFDAFANGTQTIARAIAASSAFSIAGGGDTLAAIAKYGIEQQVGYISTGGGAFLEVLEGKTLPAFEILQQRAKG